VAANSIIGNIPNLITVARLFAVPLLVWLILNNAMETAFWVFVAAGVSDALDGFIAKRFNLVTKLGSYLDPIADKALLVSTFVTLGQSDHVGTWLVILVVFRDVLIIGGTILFHTLGRAVEMRPLLISKFNTLMQIVLVSVLLATLGLDVPDYGLVPILVILVGATTVLSGLAYMVHWVLGVQIAPQWARRPRVVQGDQGRKPAEDRI
jgi:cardiolipin synthase